MKRKQTSDNMGVGCCTNTIAHLISGMYFGYDLFVPSFVCNSYYMCIYTCTLYIGMLMYPIGFLLELPAILGIWRENFKTFSKGDPGKWKSSKNDNLKNIGTYYSLRQLWLVFGVSSWWSWLQLLFQIKAKPVVFWISVFLFLFSALLFLLSQWLTFWTFGGFHI